jgi:anti-sigma factor ChrR (cupin superfamily)
VCEEAVALVTDYLEGALTRRERARFEVHVGGCPHCGEYFAQMKVTIDTLGHVEPDDLEPEVLDELVALFRRWKADDSESPNG